MFASPSSRQASVDNSQAHGGTQQVGQGRVDGEHADPARAGQPLARREVDRVGVEDAVDLAHACAASITNGTPRSRHIAATVQRVAPHHDGCRPRSGAPSPAGRRAARGGVPSSRPRSSTGSGCAPKPWAANWARFGPYSRADRPPSPPTATPEQQPQRAAGSGGEDDVAGRYSGQRATAARPASSTGGGLGRDITADLGLVAGVGAAASMAARLCREQAALSRCTPATAGRASRQRCTRCSAALLT